ncbi:UDP-glucose--hexose-1-phosphate uridylyltransferase [uncultured Tenacibaculum sp.]|uniref:UDP-glucose--hexose-1-phosphate uridylyltransferase n=1 Tax=uncultured Tenacibaculum sp. TaxID=174713 RepID=UPI00263443AB|nr:UDP-glucose--hexose-1-phosphate uridylyltransferase [uncultured Tenacibaculum sp.]
MKIYEQSHRRYNILTDEWVLVSPHRTKRPWQGKKDTPTALPKIDYDPDCYLCPGNTRANGEINPNYDSTFVFTNDFAALQQDVAEEVFEDDMLKAKTESGICKVVCFSPNHSLTLPLMKVEDITKVVQLWKEEYTELGSLKKINNVQIFENKGAIMGCSNPHPHGQIWAQNSIPEIVLKKQEQQLKHYNKTGKSLLESYIQKELQLDERIIAKNEHFVALVPFWAVWPYEVMIAPIQHYSSIKELNSEEEISFAKIIKEVTIRYDNLFETSFPYSSGIHQSPTDKAHPEWHFHMSFYPPLLRSAEVKKFMVGYEMFANPQRDISAEQAANTLKELSNKHYSL